MVDPVGDHAVWIYDRPVNMAALTAFHAALRRGLLGRAVASALVGPAGDRWTAKTQFSELDVAPEPIPAGSLDDWLAERTRARLQPYGGPGWRLSVAELDDGRSVVSLYAAHALADGLTLTEAVVDAAAGRVRDLAYRSDGYGALRLFAVDAAAATWNVLRACATLVRAALPARRVGPQAGTAAPAPVVEMPVPTIDFAVPRINAVVAAADWHAAAEARGGTPTTLAAAVAATLAARLGRVAADGRVSVAMPVSIRDGADDPRANAVTAMHFDVETDGLTDDLRPVRAAMKAQLRAIPDSARRWERLYRANLLYPRGLRARLVRRAGGTDPVTVQCMMLRGLDPNVLLIDGAPAKHVGYSLVTSDWASAAETAAKGGVLRVDAVELPDEITLHVTGFHPTSPTTAAELETVIAAALGDYQLDATFLAPNGLRV